MCIPLACFSTRSLLGILWYVTNNQEIAEHLAGYTRAIHRGYRPQSARVHGMVQQHIAQKAAKVQ